MNLAACGVGAWGDKLDNPDNICPTSVAPAKKDDNNDPVPAAAVPAAAAAGTAADPNNVANNGIIYSPPNISNIVRGLPLSPCPNNPSNGLKGAGILCFS